jgi:hypothetical protein
VATPDECDPAALESALADSELVARIEREISKPAPDRLSLPARIGAGAAGALSLVIVAWIAGIAAGVTDLSSGEVVTVVGIAAGFVHVGSVFLRSAWTGSRDLLFPFGAHRSELPDTR